METFKIAKGNSFLLHINMQKIYVSQNTQTTKVFDISNIAGLTLSLATAFSEEMQISTSGQVAVTKDEIQVSIPGCLNEDVYDIIIRGRYNGEDICYRRKNLFRIVSSNKKSCLPPGKLEGETEGIFRTQYWIELNVPDVKLELIAEPSLIVYDDTEHQIKLSWKVLEDGNEIIPDSVTVSHDGQSTSFSVEQKEMTVTLKDLGKYEYQLSAEANGHTYTTAAEIDIRKIAWYGASSVSDASSLDLDTLNHDLSTLVNQQISVKTTDTEDTVWFVSEVPLQFIQANLAVELNEENIDGVYYYYTDPLEAGDNVFDIKSK